MVAFILFVLVVASLLWLVSSFGERHPWIYSREEESIRMQERKEEALRAIQDMDFEHAAGKLSEEDYRKLRKEFKREAVSVLREMDEATGAVRGGGSSAGLLPALEREAARIRRMRRASG